MGQESELYNRREFFAKTARKVGEVAIGTGVTLAFFGIPIGGVAWLIKSSDENRAYQIAQALAAC